MHKLNLSEAKDYCNRNCKHLDPILGLKKKSFIDNLTSRLLRLFLIPIKINIHCKL